MSNSLMFQRFPTHAGYEDPQLSNFYGQALPFLKRGVPVKTVHIENVSYPKTWEDVRILLMSYSNMKPLSAEYHKHIAEWVRSGGTLVYCGRDNDPFQTVQEWWNTGANNYERPADHLFEYMNLHGFPPEGEYSYGKGIIYIICKDPKEFILGKDNDLQLVDVVKKLYENKGSKIYFKNNFALTRGNYEIISVMDESVSSDPYTIRGKFIDLFDPQLPVINHKAINAGEQAYLYNINSVKDKKKPQVLAAASRIYDEKATADNYSFVAKSPINTTNVMRILLPLKPTNCVARGHNKNEEVDLEWNWDEESKTCKLAFENNPDGVYINITL